MPEKRVAITGIGTVTPVGMGVEAFWNALVGAAACTRNVSRFDAGEFDSQVAGELDDFSARKFVPRDYRKAVKVMARDIEIAVAAADLAFRDSGIITKGIDPENTTIQASRLGCNIGAGLICSDLDELGSAVNTAVVDGKFDFKLWGSHGMDNLTPLWLLKYLPNMLACHVTIIHGAEGPSNTITCDAASSHLAVGEATRLIARGGAEAVIAGGAESKLNPMGLLRQGLLKRLCNSRNDTPAEACRPFDAEHDGTVIGEGGGLLILENLQCAEKRGAKIYAELVGFAGACDPEGFDVTRPTCGSLDLAVEGAIRDAGITPDDIDLIICHGTGVPAEDACEAQGWRDALGDRAAEIPAFAITGAMGSMFAGAGAVELAAGALAMYHQTVPPTVNFSAPAGDCELGLSDQAREKQLTYAVSCAFSVGGQSGACVLKRYQS